MRTAALALFVALLIASNIYTYIYFTSLNGYLRFTLQQLALERKRYFGEYSILMKYADELQDSYLRVVKANKQLEEFLNSLQRDLRSIPYNYTTMPYFEFVGRYMFAYTNEMRNFVLNVTGGWDGTDEDFMSDLYKIHREWRSMFVPTEEAPPPTREFLFIHIGGFDFGRVEVYSLKEGRWIILDYLKELPFSYEIKSITVSGASEVFRSRRGLCWDYAVTLVSLYNAYYDTSGRSLPTVYLSIEGRDLHHAVVLIKLEGDRVAIIDWDVITPVSNGRMGFVPFEEAKRLHEEYWGRSLFYKGYMRSRPYRTGLFNSTEKFYEWLLNELN